MAMMMATIALMISTSASRKGDDMEKFTPAKAAWLYQIYEGPVEQTRMTRELSQEALADTISRLARPEMRPTATISLSSAAFYLV
jgi:hypothetical protein